MTSVPPQGNGPFPDWDNPGWDHPVKLLPAIGLWSPAFARCLDQVNWVSPDEIRRIGQQRRHQEEMYDHPSSIRARRASAKQQGDQDAVTGSPIEAARDSAVELPDPGIPEALRGDWAGLRRDWDQWSDADRLVEAFELAGRLIIEKTRIGRPYTLKYAPPATEGLDAGYRRVGDARHDALGPYDLDIQNSTIRNPGGNWLPARISGGIEAEAERRAVIRLAHEEQDAARAAGFAARLEKPFPEREIFSVFEIAAHLTRRSVAEPDIEKRDRVVVDVDDCIRRGEFDLTGESDVAIQIGEPPYFRPFGASDIVSVPEEVAELRIHNARCIYLRRSACRRYIEANLDLPNAPKLLRAWFPEPDDAARRLSKQDRERSPMKAVRKTDPERDLRVRNQIETVMAAQRRQWSDPATRPALRQQARMIEQQLRNAQPPLKLGQETIRQILSATYRPMVRLGIGTRDG